MSSVFQYLTTRHGNGAEMLASRKEPVWWSFLALAFASALNNNVTMKQFNNKQQNKDSIPPSLRFGGQSFNHYHIKSINRTNKSFKP